MEGLIPVPGFGEHRCERVDGAAVFPSGQFAGFRGVPDRLPFIYLFGLRTNRVLPSEIDDIRDIYEEGIVKRLRSRK